MSQNIDALIGVLKSRTTEVAGAELDPTERAVIVELATCGLELLRQLLLDINRCADALEILATDRKREAAFLAVYVVVRFLADIASTRYAAGTGCSPWFLGTDKEQTARKPAALISTTRNPL